MIKTRIMLGGGLCTALLVGAGFAFQSQSSSYVAQPQAITSGGGEGDSTNYFAPQQALGPLAGSLSSTSYGTDVGAVQPVPAPPEPTSVNDWHEINY